jgi:hypothetical protein
MTGGAMASESAGGGVGVCGLLGVVFVTLKLCGVIDWSWWYVTLPFWGPPALYGKSAVLVGGAALVKVAWLLMGEAEAIGWRPVWFATARCRGQART